MIWLFWGVQVELHQVSPTFKTFSSFLFEILILSLDQKILEVRLPIDGVSKAIEGILGQKMFLGAPQNEKN